MIKHLFSNYLLILPLLAWGAAQVLKTIIAFFMQGSFKAERLVGAGGWPSAHSALVCALFIGTAKKCGVDSPLFAITFILAAIVMYDAIGVRRETGEQSKVLNMIIDDMEEEGQTIEYDKRLKEMIGHTPFQVLSGALLGILISMLVPVF